MKLKQWLLIDIGLVLVVGVLAWIFGPSLFMEAHYQKQVKQQESGEPIVGFAGILGSEVEDQQAITWEFDEATPVGGGFGELTAEEVLVAPLSPEFGLVIPKVFVNVAVTEGVNPADKEEYQSGLRTAGGVAHAAGSVLPGEKGTVYIFGHSTDAGLNVERMNAVFYLLRKLEVGDEVIAYYKGAPFRYKVKEKKTVDPDDISDITDVGDESRLVLQTCWPPGTTWKRLLIVAELVE